jgi:hypothetical protein
MNGNPDKVQRSGDAWNGEDFSMVELDDAGSPRLRMDQRVLDRVYPAAVAGRTVAFTYEDRARDGAQTLTWNRVPTTMPAVARLVGEGQYALLVWRSGGTGAPTEMRLPGTFTAAGTTVVSDLGTSAGLHPFATRGGVAARRVSAVGQRLILAAPPGEPAGTLHHALVTNGPQATPGGADTAARRELARWVAEMGFP